MAIDSQRNTRSPRSARSEALSVGRGSPRGSAASEPADGWLGSILIGGGLLSPEQLAQVKSQGGPTLWAGVTASGQATDGQILDLLAPRW